MIWMNGRHAVSEVEDLDVDVEETAKGYVVDHGDGVEMWLGCPMGRVEKGMLAEGQRCHYEVGTGMGPPEGGRVS